jgi:hypothetical protein
LFDVLDHITPLSATPDEFNAIWGLAHSCVLSDCVNFSPSVISVLRKLAKDFPETIPGCVQELFAGELVFPRTDLLVASLRFLSFACAWAAFESIMQRANTISFGALANVISANFPFRCDDCKWTRRMYRRLTVQAETDSRYWPILSAFLGRLSEYNVIRDLSSLQVRSKLTDSVHDRDHRDETLMWLYGVKALELSTEWSVSPSIVATIIKLMDHSDASISRAAHGAIQHLQKEDKTLRKRVGRIPPIDYADDYETNTPGMGQDQEARCRCQCSTNWFLDFAGVSFNVLFVLALFLAPVLVAISLYLMILVVYSLFTSALISYVFSPLFGGLNADVFAAISSVLRLFMCAPLIALFAIFLIRSD